MARVTEVSFKAGKYKDVIVDSLKTMVNKEWVEVNALILKIINILLQNFTKVKG